MRDFVLGVICTILAGIGFYLVVRVLDAPVVYKDPNGEICGCITAENYKSPTKEACASVDMDGLHEVVYVGNCKEE